MGRCNECNRSTHINSDRAGRDGASAKDIAKLTGKFRGGTDEEFIEWLKLVELSLSSSGELIVNGISSGVNIYPPDSVIEW